MNEPEPVDRASNEGPHGESAKSDGEPSMPTAESSDESDLLPQFITPLAPLEHQVGRHVISALEHPQTIAVITTVAAGSDGSQQIVSVGLDKTRFEQVQRLLSGTRKEKKRRVQCVGFHCQFVDDDETETAGK